MSSENTVTLVGNATRDPELRFTNGGRAIASFGMAVSRRYQQNGEWQEQTSFFNVVAWGQLGENLAQSVTKGCRVFVTGRLEQRQYEARDGSGTKSIVEVVADEAGPSLRWATCTVERAARGDSDGQPKSGSGRSNGGQQRSTAGEGYGSGYGDEEPF